MAKQQETEGGVPVNVPESYRHEDGVPVNIPESPDAGTTKGQKATTKEK